MTYELIVRRWSWPGPTGKPVYNFRSEGREFPSGRCLIIADGFYEFTAPADPKQKRKDRWLFASADGEMLGIAGLVRAHPQIGEAFTMLTTEPGPGCCALSQPPGSGDPAGGLALVARPQPCRGRHDRAVASRILVCDALAEMKEGPLSRAGDGGPSILKGFWRFPQPAEPQGSDSARLAFNGYLTANKRRGGTVPCLDSCRSRTG